MYFKEHWYLVWYGHDLGPAVGFLRPGATEYEFWRYVPTEFDSWLSGGDD